MSNDTRVDLSRHEQMTLKRIASSSADGREVRRSLALVWLNAGESVNEVAERLNVSRQMIYGVVARYQSRAERRVLERIQDAPHTGRPAEKRDQVECLLQHLLPHAPTEFGYRAHTWTVGTLHNAIERRLEIEVSEATLQRVLDRMGQSYQRPRYGLARRDPHWRQAKGGCKPG